MPRRKKQIVLIPRPKPLEVPKTIVMHIPVRQ